MRFNAALRGLAVAAALAVVSSTAAAQQAGDGEGVDSNLLWPTPGPSHYVTLQSSDIVGNLGVAFGALFGYYRDPLAVTIHDPVSGSEDDDWIVEYAATADFMWAFGILDVLQVGLALPVVLDQGGVGATPFQPAGADSATYELASSALRDMRVDVKARLLGGNAEDPDRRGFGLALDAGMSVPTGDELNFAGDEEFVFMPTGIVDYHDCCISAALNFGARLRTTDSRLADLSVGHQGTAGLGVTGHLLDRRLLLSAEGVALVELDGFDRVGLEYRGAAGWVPDEARAVTLWLSGGSAAGTGDLLGTPSMRFLLGLTYAPGPEDQIFGM